MGDLPKVMQWALSVQGTPAAYMSCYKYEPQGDGEIELLDNEIVRVVEKFDEHGDPDWWRVERSDGVAGIVPSTYLEKVPNNADARFYNTRLRGLKKSDSFESLFQAGDSAKTHAENQANAEAQAQNVPTSHLDTERDSAVHGGDGEVVPEKSTMQSLPEPEPVEPLTTQSSVVEGIADLPDLKKQQVTATMSNMALFDQASRRESDMLYPPTTLTRTSSASSYGELEIAEGDLSFLKELDPRVNGPDPFLKITLGMPRKTGKITKVVTWIVATQTNFPEFRSKGWGVRRKYEDFLWLHDVLEGELPDCLVPPLVEAAGTMSQITGGIDDHYIFKRTLTAQSFVNRLASRPLFNQHPMFRLLLQGTSAELKRMKKVKVPKRNEAKHPASTQKPERDPMLVAAQSYYEQFISQLKDIRDKAGNNVKISKEATNTQNFYFSNWLALANNENYETYTKRAMSLLGNEMKTLEANRSSQVLEMEKVYRQNIKDLLIYMQEALNYIQRVYDYEDTVAYWVWENQKVTESLQHKSSTLEELGQTSRPPKPQPIEDGPGAVKAAQAAAKQEKKDMKEYKKQQQYQRDLSKKITDLEKKQAELCNNVAQAQARLDTIRSVMWRELRECDFRKEQEMQSIHETWLQSRIEMHKEVLSTLDTVLSGVNEPMDFKSHGFMAGWAQAGQAEHGAL